MINSQESKRIPNQGLPPSSNTNTVVSHSWSAKPETTRSSPIHFTGNNSTLPGDDADQPLCNNALLKGVVVACDHFLRGNNRQSSKVCAACKQPGNSSCLRYVVLNRTSNNWQKLRSFPAFNVPSKAKWDLCRNFNQGKRCAKKPCPFPHGEVESAMWTMERNGGKLFWCCFFFSWKTVLFV